jgi:hypothetical protein
MKTGDESAGARLQPGNLAPIFTRNNRPRILDLTLQKFYLESGSFQSRWYCAIIDDTTWLAESSIRGCDFES